MSAVKSVPADPATTQNQVFAGEQDDASDRLASWIAELSLDEARITFVFDGYDESSDEENVDSKNAKSHDPFGVPQSLLRDMRNLNCSDSDSDSSDTDDEEAQHAGFIRKQRELRRYRLCHASSRGKRTVSERSESDDEGLGPLDPDAVGSSARRLRRRVGNRGSLVDPTNQTSSTEPLVEEKDGDGPVRGGDWSPTLLDMPFFGESSWVEEDDKLQDLFEPQMRSSSTIPMTGHVGDLCPPGSILGAGELTEDLKTPALPGEAKCNSQMAEHNEIRQLKESRVPGLNQKQKAFDEPQLRPESALLPKMAIPYYKRDPLLACPYLKHDAAKYGQRKSCRGAAFEEIHRLKEHLHRVHRQKENCPRCGTMFDDEEEKNQHLKSQNVCEVVEGISLEGYDKAQGEKLKSKKRVRGVNSREDKWKHLYGILFPHCKDTPDPFYRPIFDDKSRKSGLIRMDLEDTENALPRDIPPQLEEETYALAEKAIGMELSEAKRRKLMEVFRGFAVKMGQLPQKEEPAVRAGKEVAHVSSEERTYQEPEGSERTPGSSEMSPSFLTPDAAEPMAMFALSSKPGAGASDVVPTNIANVAPPHVEPRMPPLAVEVFDMGEEFEFGDWSQWSLENGTTYDWINGESHQLRFSLEEHSDFLRVQHFEDYGGYLNTVTTGAFLAANEYPVAGTNQGWAATDGRWVGM